ncbi:MAG: hypothetical protein M1826_001175 [Phylliscum demangeonii]|nr:MAG: hypothetical protein M1826_001175 [Phylliscum demangeonii]
MKMISSTRFLPILFLITSAAVNVLAGPATPVRFSAAASNARHALLPHLPHHRFPAQASPPLTDRAPSSAPAKEPLPSGKDMVLYCSRRDADCDRCSPLKCALTCDDETGRCKLKRCQPGASPILTDPKFVNSVQAFYPVNYHKCRHGDRGYQFGPTFGDPTEPPRRPQPEIIPKSPII